MNQIVKQYKVKILEGWGVGIYVKERVSLKEILNHSLKTPSVKEIFDYWTGWVGSKIVWAEVNRVKISSCVKDLKNWFVKTRVRGRRWG